MNVNRRELLRSLVATPVAAAVGASLPAAPVVGDGVLAWAYLPPSRLRGLNFDKAETWTMPDGEALTVEWRIIA